MKNLTRTTMLLFVILLSVLLTGCMKPPKLDKFVEIKPNETAFVIPLSGDVNKQAKFDSEEQLQKLQVAAKRIKIPQVEKRIGRFEYEIEWIDGVLVVKVDRSPQSREWTNDPDTGSNSKKQSFMFESRNSIGFSLGSTITALITEQNTARFLYLYSGKKLEFILDTTIRNRASDLLSQEFSMLDLDGCRINKKIIFDKVFKQLKLEFEEDGITIEQFGVSGQITYSNKEIQKSIDSEFINKNLRKIEADKKLANDETRKNAKAEADKDLYVARQKAKALKTVVANRQLDNQKEYIKALQISAEKGQPIVSKTVLSKDGNMLLNFDIE